MLHHQRLNQRRLETVRDLTEELQDVQLLHLLDINNHSRNHRHLILVHLKQLLIAYQVCVCTCVRICAWYVRACVCVCVYFLYICHVYISSYVISYLKKRIAFTGNLVNLHKGGVSDKIQQLLNTLKVCLHSIIVTVCYPLNTETKEKSQADRGILC